MIIKKRAWIIIGVALLIGISAFVVSKNGSDTGRKTYKNSKYDYVLTYPSTYNKASVKDPDYISFYGMNGGVSIKVESSGFTNSQQWADANKVMQRFERTVRVAGYDAIIMHFIGETGDIYDSNITGFIKDGKLFTILSESSVHDEILNSFYFK